MGRHFSGCPRAALRIDPALTTGTKYNNFQGNLREVQELTKTSKVNRKICQSENISHTAQLIIYIRGVNKKFEVTEKLVGTIKEQQKSF